MSQASLMGQNSMGKNTDGNSGQVPPTLSHRIVQTPEKGWERLWLWASERINPIVVKEIRQSLKSKQFTISFSLTLVAAVTWTLLAISMMVPRIFYVPAGLQLLSGYFCVLAIPLMVIIPFGAYLSLTAETEDSTFELLSISALTSLQIVHGKMASACVQILLYLSALAPCIVLTYLLRGVELFTILFFLGWTVVLSVCETAIALLLGSVARTRMLQVGAAVFVLAGLFFALVTWLSFLTQSGLTSVTNPEGVVYLVMLGFGTVIAVALSLVLRAAAAAIDFPSENNSTPLRRRIVLLVSITFFWVLFGTVASQQEEFSVVFLWAAFILCLIVGALVTGERGVISPRAQRSLPQTFVGRMFLTWYYPGAGQGYILLICLYAAIVGTLLGVDVAYASTLKNNFGQGSVIAAGFMLLCYLTIYLGFNRLIMLLVPRHVPARMIVSVALLAVILVLAHILPLFFAFYMNDYREFDYAWHQSFNIIWSTTEAIESVSLDIGASIVIVTLCALGIFGLNLGLCTRDVMLVRVVLPPRVRSDDDLLAPQKTVPADPFAD